jgi:hypothetical protein
MDQIQSLAIWGTYPSLLNFLDHDAEKTILVNTEVYARIYIMALSMRVLKFSVRIRGMTYWWQL